MATRPHPIAIHELAPPPKEVLGQESTRDPERFPAPGKGHPTRIAIIACLKKNPGLNLKSLCQAIGANRGTATHHLRVLERDGIIKSERQGRERLFVVHSAYRLRDRIEDLGELGLETAAKIAASPGARRRMLAAWLSVEEDALQIPLETLVTNGLVEERRSARDHAYYPLSAMAQLILVPEAKPERQGPD